MDEPAVTVQPAAEPPPALPALAPLPPSSAQTAPPGEPPEGDVIAVQPTASMSPPVSPLSPRSPDEADDPRFFSVRELEKVIVNKRDFLQMRCCCSCSQDLDTCSCYMGDWMRDLAHFCIPCTCLCLPCGGLCGLCNPHCPTCLHVSLRDPWRGVFAPCPPPRRCGRTMCCASCTECLAETVGGVCFAGTYALACTLGLAMVLPSIMIAHLAMCAPCVWCHKVCANNDMRFIWPPEFLAVRLRKKTTLAPGITQQEFTVKSPWKRVHKRDLCLAWVAAVDARTPRRAAANEPHAAPVGTLCRVVTSEETSPLRFSHPLTVVI